jgi:hypothetical protein
MILFLSGNFPQLSDPKKEKEMMDFLLNSGYNCNRMITFYYRKECNVVLNLVRPKSKEINFTGIPKVKSNLKTKSILKEKTCD